VARTRHSLTSFVGRKSELSRLRDLLGSARIVTLTGIGGVGKTRLAEHIATEVASQFGNGTCMVDLTAARLADEVHECVLRAVDLPQGQNFSGTILERLVATLRPHELLLVLDNCERVTAATRELVVTLTRECPDVGFLTTSQQPLDVAGENVFAVAPLPIPLAGGDLSEVTRSDAVQLFCDRARSRRSDFDLSKENAQDVAELCRRLEGIPLSIELAASRMGTLNAADILERLESPLHFLTHQSLSQPERHKTLRRTLDWSYGLLNETDQTVFRRSAAFVGGFDLRAIEHVAGGAGVESDGVLNAVTRLVDRSLLSVSHVHGRVRYAMLETVREYAEELLLGGSDESDTRERHGLYFRDFARTAGVELTGTNEAEWVEQLKADLPNIGAALNWALATYRISVATDIIFPLQLMQFAFDETIGTWSELVLSYPHPEQDPRRPGVLAFACYVRYFYRGNSEAAELVRELLETTRSADLAIQVTVLNLACGLALLNGWPFAPLTERYLEAARQFNDPFHLVHARSASVWARHLDGENALDEAEDVVRYARTLGNPSALAIALQAHAMAAVANAPERALVMLDESIAAAAAVRSDFTENVSRSMRSTLLVSSLDPKTVIDVMLESLEGPLGRSRPGLGRIWIVEVAALLALGGREETACVVLGGLPRVAPPTSVLWPFAPKEFRAVLEALPDRIGRERWATLLAKGADMTSEELIVTVRAEAAHLPSRVL
jgi:predicted ATPase